jgi:hypothetical protein
VDLLGSDGVTAVSHFVVLPRVVVGRFGEVYDRRGWSIRFLRAKVFRSLLGTAGYRDKKYITQTADSEHFLITNYHTTDFCTYEIRVYRVRMFYLT